MRVKDVTLRNFRILEDVSLCLEEGTTLIVGRNNCGKTSLTALFRRLLEDAAPKFYLEDFSLGVHEHFWSALKLHRQGGDAAAIREIIPSISATMDVEYSTLESLGPLSEFVVDLNDACTTARIVVTYALVPGRLTALFEGLGEERDDCFKKLRDRIPKLYAATIEAVDPYDPSNRKVLEASDLRKLLQFDFINAQRAIDDASTKEKAVLGKVFERLFTSASRETTTEGVPTTADELKSAVQSVQEKIDNDFNSRLLRLAPTFELFGYPGLLDPMLRTETVLNVEQLLSNHTTVGYEGPNGIKLPESYNGLGTRNLIFILLKLFEFFRDFTTRPHESGIHLIFIEEPEAHLHPQMQTVFIRKLSEIKELFEIKYNGGSLWPVQFIVTTHSSHIANEASFDSMRYFHATRRETGENVLRTVAKDLRNGLSTDVDREFLHKYMTLTRCDLLFADRAILVEGTTERLMLPQIIKIQDKAAAEGVPRLGNQYLSIMEVGGAYSHIFFNLLDFLGLRSLIVTDLDSTKEVTNDKGLKRWKKCKVSEGTRSSNSTINQWFAPGDQPKPSPGDLLTKVESEKTSGCRRIAYQIPHTEGDACGRSFEDAFMLANPVSFEITGATLEEREAQAWEKAKGIDKTGFALKYAITEEGWTTPKYITEGLAWLAQGSNVPSPVETAVANIEEEGATDG